MHIREIARREPVLCAAAVAAIATTALMGDPAALPGYLDLSVLALLFCLMATVEGFRASGALTRIGRALVSGTHTERGVCLALVLLPFFASMAVTNDVALFAFVPLALIALETAGWERHLPVVCVLQAIAANLGGMVTPVGNPQNLYIFTHYRLDAVDFFSVLAPYGLLALALLVICCLRFGNSASRVETPAPPALDRRRAGCYAALFAFCLLGVARIVPYGVLFALVAGLLLVFDRAVLARIDYALLATFACFFLFSGNLAHLPAAADALTGLMEEAPLAASLLASQVISNVPAAVLLSDFTNDWHALLLGVDLGGLGTPVASLASLIALRLYLHAPGASHARFLKPFALANAGFLAALLALYLVLEAFA